MENETIQDAGTTVQAQETENDASNEETPNVEELIRAEIAKYQEQSKREIAGLNKRNSELENRLKQSSLEKLSEEDRLKEEIRLAQLEKEEVEKETKALKRSRVIDKALFDAGLPQEFASRVTGEDDESIAKDVLAFKEFITGQAEQQAESIINKRLGGKAPVHGQEPAGNLTLEEIAALPPEQRKEAYKKAGYL